MTGGFFEFETTESSGLIVQVVKAEVGRKFGIHRCRHAMFGTVVRSGFIVFAIRLGPLCIANELDRIFQPINKIFEVLFVEENLVLVVLELTVLVNSAFAFGYGQIMLVPLCAFYIEKVGSFSCPHWS